MPAEATRGVGTESKKPAILLAVLTCPGTRMATAKESASSEPIDFVDPHFHVWDITDDGVHDGKILFAPEGKKDFRAEDYEKMMTSKTKGNTTQGVYL